MPQMAPMLWLYLFVFFIFVYMIFLILNFFSKLPTPAYFNKEEKSLPSLSWKW
uniref:ATP synthase complex subunit 8 n=1 Tax=Stenopus hispidus TaxID=6815 RepID=I6N109_STEHS|nr:ATP synthase F0 subunit 8 [Stenopus hispidus]AEO18303.1 ATP synthase F0 subunit 8 [Stenopus hispidus]AGA56092.1 ATP synthase F0 subunit 8 [Stenopus hispidus]